MQQHPGVFAAVTLQQRTNLGQIQRRMDHQIRLFPGLDGLRGHGLSCLEPECLMLIELRVEARGVLCRAQRRDGQPGDGEHGGPAAVRSQHASPLGPVDASREAGAVAVTGGGQGSR